MQVERSHVPAELTNLLPASVLRALKNDHRVGASWSYAPRVPRKIPCPRRSTPIPEHTSEKRLADGDRKEVCQMQIRRRNTIGCDDWVKSESNPGHGMHEIVTGYLPMFSASEVRRPTAKRIE